MADDRKDDNGKLRWTLLPFDALRHVVKVLTDGAAKYGTHSWMQLEDAENRYADALMRHMDDYLEGKRIDDDSGSPVMAHVAANALFLLWFGLNTSRVEPGESEDYDPAADIFGLSPEDRWSVVTQHDPITGINWQAHKIQIKK